MRKLMNPRPKMVVKRSVPTITAMGCEADP